MKLLVGICIVSFLSFPLLAFGDTPEDIMPFEDITKDVGRGFGDHMQRYTWALHEFNGDIYDGTWSVTFDYEALIGAIIGGGFPGIGGGGDILGAVDTFTKTNGGEIWKYDVNAEVWHQVLKAPVEDRGIRRFEEYNGKLYAGTANYSNGNQIYVSSDGETWTKMLGGPTSDLNNRSIRTMKVYNYKGTDYLMVGTENKATGGELWAYSDGSGWQKILGGLDESVAKVHSFNGDLYAGTWNFTAGNYKLVKVNGINDYTDVTPVFPGSGALSNLGVMSMEDRFGKLYLGTVNYTNGFTFLSTDDPMNPAGWNVLSTNGFGNLGAPGSSDNAYVWALQNYEDMLVMGTFNSGLTGGVYSPLPIPLDGRGQLWYTKDGVNWYNLVDDGFGSKFTYGIRDFAVANGTLFAGTASNFFIPDISAIFDEFFGDDGLSLESFSLLPLLFGPVSPESLELMSGLLGRISPDQLELLGGILGRIPPEKIAQLQGFFGSFIRDFDIGTQVFASQKVPEPATMLLFGSGLIGFAIFRRKKVRG